MTRKKKKERRLRPYLRAIIVLAAVEFGQLTKIVALVTLGIAAFLIPPAHARLVVLYSARACLTVLLNSRIFSLIYYGHELKL